MNAGKTVFAQAIEHLPRYEFDKFVKKNTRAINGAGGFPAICSTATNKQSPLTFVGIDFETADHGADSVCAVGLVRVEGDRVLCYP